MEISPARNPDGLPPSRRILGGTGEVGTSGRLIRGEKASLMVPLFIFLMLIPVFFYVGPLRLSPYRLILIFTLIPTVIIWISGRAGKIRAPDVLFLLSALWAALALVVNDGVELAIEPAGILFVETFGSYLLARVFIRNAASFGVMVKALFWTIVLLLPLAIFESLTGRPIVLEVLGNFFTVFSDAPTEPRYGFERAQVVFEHPILFGAFSTSAFGLTYCALGYKKNFISNIFRSAVVILASLLSVSTGAIAALAAQIIFMLWNFFTRKIPRRWTILSWLTIFAYFIVDIFSNRTPFHVFVTYLTFNVSSAYGRILIWNFGTAEVARHPFFGVGLGEWERPTWMSGSMDNFWLVIAVSYGLPAVIFFIGAVVLIIRRIGKAELHDGLLHAYRQGLLISLGGFILAGATVHYWNAIYSWFMILLGSGMWMLDLPDAESGKNPKGGKSISERAALSSVRSG